LPCPPGIDDRIKRDACARNPIYIMLFLDILGRHIASSPPENDRRPAPSTIYLHTHDVTGSMSLISLARVPYHRHDGYRLEGSADKHPIYP
jgi:hypothetical protein